MLFKGYPIKLLDGYTLPVEFFKGARVFDKNNKKTEEKVEDKECNKANGKQDGTKEKHEEEKVKHEESKDWLEWMG